MIKFLKNQDILISEFAVSKEKTADYFFNDILLLTDEDYSFPLILSVEECNFNLNSSDISGSLTTIKSGCDDSIDQNRTFLGSSPKITENNPVYRFGKKYTSDIPFYTTDEVGYDEIINPVNDDGTYKGQVYNRIKNMYYNDYNNVYSRFGLDGFDDSNKNLKLTNGFTEYQFHITQSGDRLRQNSIVINNQTGDIVAFIKDDGNNNLYLSGSYYINNFIKYTSNQNNVKLYNDHGISKYIYYAQSS